MKVNPYGQWENKVVCTACIARLVKLRANGTIMETSLSLKLMLNVSIKFI